MSDSRIHIGLRHDGDVFGISMTEEEVQAVHKLQKENPEKYPSGAEGIMKALRDIGGPIIRDILPEEIWVLDDFLYDAIFIPEGELLPPRSIIENEDLQVYVRDFGKRADDRCLVAEMNGKIVGAVWSRIMNDYGHLDNETPSLAISLYKEYRGKGIGTQLLSQMLERLREDGYKQVSLSVQRANYALRMYLEAGFEIVEDRGDEVLMLHRL